MLQIVFEITEAEEKVISLPYMSICHTVKSDAVAANISLCSNYMEKCFYEAEDVGKVVPIKEPDKRPKVRRCSGVPHGGSQSAMLHV